VVLDVFKYRQDQGNPVNPGTTDQYSVDDLEGARQAQGVEFQGADILLVPAIATARVCSRLFDSGGREP